MSEVVDDKWFLRVLLRTVCIAVHLKTLSFGCRFMYRCSSRSHTSQILFTLRVLLFSLLLFFFFFHKIRFSRQRKNVISKIFQNHSKHQSHCSKLFAFYPIFFILWPSWNFISCSLNKYFCYQKCIAIFGVHSVWFTFFIIQSRNTNYLRKAYIFFPSV